MNKNVKIGLLIGGGFLLFFVAITIGVVCKMGGSKHISSSGYVAVVELAGVIMDSQEFVNELDELRKDKNLKAVVVRINSPGGLVAPSEEIYHALKETDEKIPVIASMGSVAASGGYYAALGARKIYANAGTLTASIGVIMELAYTNRLYEWAKIDRYVLKAGKFKDIGSSLRQMKPEEREIMQAMLTNMHDDFRAKVMEGRGFKAADLENVADGRVVTGLQALDMKLVDEIGTLSKAIKFAKETAGLEDDAFVHYPTKEEGWVRKIILGEKAPALDKFLGQLNYMAPTPGPRFYYLMTGY